MAAVTTFLRRRVGLACFGVLLLAVAANGSAASAPPVTPRSVAARHPEPPPIDETAGRVMAAARSGLAAQEVIAQRVPSWVWQVTLPQDRLVLIYGSPGGMGLFGTLSDSALIIRTRAQAAAYTRLDPAHPAIPGLDFVTPVAQPWPMGDGSWTTRAPDGLIQRYLNLALGNHMLFFFDMQVGLSTVGKELDHLAPYLVDPEVGLALDPEFDMRAGGTPGRQFGTMSAAEINLAIDRLASVVDAFDLPPKVLIVHQFLDSMLPDRGAIRLRPEVSLIVCVDGFGPPGPKVDDYHHFNLPTVQYPGFKLFYNQDRPLMSEGQVLGLNPSPVMVMYQ